MLDVFDPFIDFVEVKSNIEICRDPRDNFLLSLAIDGKANYLLTGDNDLLIINNIGQTQIITVADFLSLNIH